MVKKLPVWIESWVVEVEENHWAAAVLSCVRLVHQYVPDNVIVLNEAFLDSG